MTCIVCDGHGCEFCPADNTAARVARALDKLDLNAGQLDALSDAEVGALAAMLLVRLDTDTDLVAA